MIASLWTTQSSSYFYKKNIVIEYIKYEEEWIVLQRRVSLFSSPLKYCEAEIGHIISLTTRLLYDIVIV